MEEDRKATNLGQSDDLQHEAPTPAKTPKRRFVGRKLGDAPRNADGPSSIEENGANNGAVQVHEPRRSARTLNRIPDSILQDDDINAAIALLPPNYNFEIHKTIHRIRQSGCKNVALQFPEGLLLFATTISDILERFCEGIQTVIMGDVTYGACCIDDFTARALGCDLLIHYAHSCLIPMSVTQINTLYVFVSIGIDTQHLINTLERNFESGKTIAMVGTIQFNAAIHTIVPQCRRVGLEVVVPQIQPLSKGEILGCTSPRMPTPASVAAALKGSANEVSSKTQQVAPDALLYVGDGRFHLESAMIHNPSLPAYRYDPYSRRLTREYYSHTDLHQLRTNAITLARSARRWGLILGSLGRQGNPHTLTLIEKHLERKGIAVVKLSLSEIMPGKLALMEAVREEGDGGVEAWVQVACPRLSIDWGYAFGRPLLSPYEALVALGVKEAGWMVGGDSNVGGSGKGVEGREEVYPMDYYEKNGLGRVTVEDVQAVG